MAMEGLPKNEGIEQEREGYDKFYQKEADEQNTDRGIIDKVFSRNEVSAIDVAHQEALNINKHLEGRTGNYTALVAFTEKYHPQPSNFFVALEQGDLDKAQDAGNMIAHDAPTVKEELEVRREYLTLIDAKAKEMIEGDEASAVKSLSEFPRRFWDPETVSLVRQNEQLKGSAKLKEVVEAHFTSLWVPDPMGFSKKVKQWKEAGFFGEEAEKKMREGLLENLPQMIKEQHPVKKASELVKKYAKSGLIGDLKQIGEEVNKRDPEAWAMASVFL